MAERLIDVTQAAEDVRRVEHELEQARDRLREALRAAHREGASYALLGQAAGLSRQRIAQLLGP